MEDQKSTLLMRSSLTSGIYLGLISILLSVIIWAGSIIESMGIFGAVIIGLFSFVLTFILVLIFSKNYKKKAFGEYINFIEVFKFALLAIIFSIVISLIYTFIFNKFIDPEYTKNLMAVLEQKTLQFMESKGAPESQIDKTLEKFKDIPSLGETLKQTVINGLIAGVIISLIVSLIVRKKPEENFQ